MTPAARAAIVLALVSAAPRVALAQPGTNRFGLNRLHLGVGVTTASGQGQLADWMPPAAPGWQLQLGVGLHGIPLTLGLGGGAFRFSKHSYEGPRGVWIRDGEISFGPSTVVRTSELRHFEVALRIEPEWRHLRPFIEAMAGTAQLFASTALMTDWQGTVLAMEESSNSLTYAIGAGGGLDVEPGWKAVLPSGSLSVVFSAAVRFWRGGELEIDRLEDRGGGARLAAGSAPLRLWAASLGIFVISRPP